MEKLYFSGISRVLDHISNIEATGRFGSPRIHAETVKLTKGDNPSGIKKFPAE